MFSIGATPIHAQYLNGQNSSYQYPAPTSSYDHDPHHYSHSHNEQPSSNGIDIPYPPYHQHHHGAEQAGAGVRHSEAFGTASKMVWILVPPYQMPKIAAASRLPSSPSHLNKSTANLHSERRPSASSSASSPDSEQHFMQRVSNIPLVNKSINQIGAAYEATKNASRVVKYSAESVETGVKTITKPVLNMVEPALAPLDRLLCNQMDKLERSFPSIISPHPSHPSSQPPITPRHPHPIHSSSSYQTMDGIDSPRESEIRTRPRSRSASSVDLLSPPPVPLVSDIPMSPQLQSAVGGAPMSPTFRLDGPPLTNALPGANSAPGGAAGQGQYRLEDGPMTTAPHIDRKPRQSRWHQVVAGVGGTFGGLVLSDETMRGLKYCLQWLQYATGHIDRQIAILRDYLLRAGGNVTSFLAGVATGTSTSQPTPPLSPQSADLVPTTGTDLLSVVSAIKREVVETLRRVVDVIGRYAAVYLPGEARRTVRGFILSMPGRWATLNQDGSAPTASSSSSTVPPPPPGPTAEAQKVLTLASESSNMLKGIMNIFAQTVDGAERYLGRVVGWPASNPPSSASSSSSSSGPSGAPPAIEAPPDHPANLHHHHPYTRHRSHSMSSSTTSEASGSSKGKGRQDCDGDSGREADDDMEMGERDGGGGSRWRGGGGWLFL
ncbi:transcription factor Opi1-domain-containing protein [Blyttiomyces helicus]|uniref:Transcription factor Opi1-domain-containing protein n=1 Tax=Blyttiomyces helicus TaxID=388810 RepID=A0A4P9WBI1_9FUNG|nr:transcription factor Opi1-domain-containing protein [Blyttiomyces helicus]|eukprot:RKO89979.1 transcription factor Opi1-domain-containing protein [Blyttiomyces helicus]